MGGWVDMMVVSGWVGGPDGGWWVGGWVDMRVVSGWVGGPDGG